MSGFSARIPWAEGGEGKNLCGPWGDRPSPDKMRVAWRRLLGSASIPDQLIGGPKVMIVRIGGRLVA